VPNFAFSGGSASGGFNMSLWNVGFLIGLLSNTFSSSRSATQVVYNAAGGDVLILNGTFTGFDANGDPTGGTLTSFQYTTSFFGSPATAMTVSGLSRPLQR
jgi:hypothetical protein